MLQNLLQHANFTYSSAVVAHAYYPMYIYGMCVITQEARTPLHMASEFNNANTAAVYISNGASIEAKDKVIMKNERS